MLEVRGIDAGYGDVQVLSGLSLEVEDKEIVTLLGSNGAGKTTTLRCITGVLAPRKGDVFFRGNPLSKVPASDRAGMGIALVPEGRELWPQLTVRENLELGAYHSRARGRAAKNLEKVHALFPRLLERKSQMAGSLSGGEQQMCAIARGLMSNPRYLLLDEPSVGLAPIVVKQVMVVIDQIAAQGIGVLLVEQNAAVALKQTQYAYVLENSRFAIEGPSAALQDDDRVRKAYLGL
jgi:branched-chain amino acid transport system ATP-binding protein